MTKQSPRLTQSEVNPDRALGYSPNAESKFTRRVSAPGGAQPTFNRERQTWSKLDLAIEHQARIVARLERRAVAARGIPEVYNPVCVRLQKTRHMLARMRAEQKGLVS